jgi:hypothetical protein
MQVAAGIVIFLLIIGAAAWLLKPRSPTKTVDTEVDPAYQETQSGAPEGGTPAVPPAPGNGPTTQDTGGGSVPSKPV